MKNVLLVAATIIVVICVLSFESFAQLQPPPRPRQQIDTSPRPYPTPSTSPTAPKVTGFAINNAASNTTSRTVTLNNWFLTAGGASYFRASERSDFSDNNAYWRPYSSAPQWLLSLGSGQKTVYFQIKNAAGLESNIVSDTIIFTEYKSFYVGAGDAYEYARGKGYTFTAVANDPNSECVMKKVQWPQPGALLLTTSARELTAFGAKCEYTLFNKSLREGWTYVSDIIDNRHCKPLTDYGAYTIIQKPSAGSRSITYKIRSWCNAHDVLRTCSCSIYLINIEIYGPATGRWEDAFQ